MKNEGLLSTLLRANVRDFRPVVFWSINSELGEEELCRQIGEMKSFGLGGFIFHARAGLTTEYLSNEWFRLVGVCLEEAKKQDLKVWMYDEFGWPSGFVGGKLLSERDFRARYLEYEIKDEFDGSAFAVYSLDGGTPRLLKRGERAEKYHTLYERVSDAYVDILNPAVTERFIEETHEKYFERFAPSFGKELLGFFTDEPQFYRYATPVSAVTEQEFFKTYGENLKDGLIYLFLNDEKGYPFRVKYYNLMNRLYCENFYGKLNDWCEGHGCMLTGHSVEETCFFTQMWGGADCASSYLYEHIPAIDNLAKYSPANISARSAGSVAAQRGVNLVMTETFGCSGNSATPMELRHIADKQYVHGVDLMCQHLYNYSIAGQGKTDHPVHFGRTLPWISGYKTFNDYFARLGFLIASSKEEAPVAVVTPMESVYLDYQRLSEDAARENVDVGFAKIADALRENGVAYQFVNEKVLEKLGGVRDGRLVVGKCAYSAVVLANCRELKENTVRLLTSYLKEGGKLAVEGAAPAFGGGVPADLSALKSNVSLVALPKPSAVVACECEYTCRTLDSGARFVFAVNDSAAPAKLSLTGRFSELNLETLEGFSPQSEFTVPPFGSLLLEENGAYKEPPFTAKRKQTIVPAFVGREKNCLTLENAQVLTENGETLSGYVYGVFETLVKRGYCGKIRVRYVFESDAARKISLLCEKQNVRGERFNGKPVRFSQDASDINFIRADVCAEAGENVYEYEADFADSEQIKNVLFDDAVPESLRNCFSYATLMEPVYPEGDFDASGDRLSAPAPKTAGDLTKQGLQNFCGAAEYSFALQEGGKILLRPIGNFAMCEFFCEGEKSTVLLGESATMRLAEGGHEIRVRCYSTMRNKFGPFHCAYDENGGVSPDFFTLRGGWKDERTNAAYTPEKKLVPFGLESIEVSFEK